MCYKDTLYKLQASCFIYFMCWVQRILEAKSGMALSIDQVQLWGQDFMLCAKNETGSKVELHTQEVNVRICILLRISCLISKAVFSRMMSVLLPVFSCICDCLIGLICALLSVYLKPAPAPYPGQTVFVTLLLKLSRSVFLPPVYDQPVFLEPWILTELCLLSVPMLILMAYFFD